ncbi:unnamed protein product, partial [Trichogramma brassicae]
MRVLRLSIAITFEFIESRTPSTSVRRKKQSKVPKEETKTEDFESSSNESEKSAIKSVSEDESNASIISGPDQERQAMLEAKSNVPTGFRVGMKLEAVDRKDSSSVCVATVAGVMDNRILVHFDSWDDLYDYWADVALQIGPSVDVHAAERPNAWGMLGLSVQLVPKQQQQQQQDRQCQSQRGRRGYRPSAEGRRGCSSCGRQHDSLAGSAGPQTSAGSCVGARHRLRDCAPLPSCDAQTVSKRPKTTTSPDCRPSSILGFSLQRNRSCGSRFTFGRALVGPKKSRDIDEWIQSWGATVGRHYSVLQYTQGRVIARDSRLQLTSLIVWTRDVALSRASLLHFCPIRVHLFLSGKYGHMINTKCSSSHNRRALCCKMSVEFDRFLESGKKKMPLNVKRTRWEDEKYKLVTSLYKIFKQINDKSEFEYTKTFMISCFYVRIILHDFRGTRVPASARTSSFWRTQLVDRHELTYFVATARFLRTLSILDLHARVVGLPSYTGRVGIHVHPFEIAFNENTLNNLLQATARVKGRRGRGRRRRRSDDKRVCSAAMKEQLLCIRPRASCSGCGVRAGGPRGRCRPGARVHIASSYTTQHVLQRAANMHLTCASCPCGGSTPSLRCQTGAHRPRRRLLAGYTLPEYNAYTTRASLPCVRLGKSGARRARRVSLNFQLYYTIRPGLRRNETKYETFLDTGSMLVASTIMRLSLRNKLFTILGQYWIPMLSQWFCHFDDDNYVNVPRLLKLLDNYNPREDWYLGRPSIPNPLEIVKGGDSTKRPVSNGSMTLRRSVYPAQSNLRLDYGNASSHWSMIKNNNLSEHRNCYLVWRCSSAEIQLMNNNHYEPLSGFFALISQTFKIMRFSCSSGSGGGRSHCRAQPCWIFKANRWHRTNQRSVALYSSESETECCWPLPRDTISYHAQDSLESPGQVELYVVHLRASEYTSENTFIILALGARAGVGSGRVHRERAPLQRTVIDHETLHSLSFARVFAYVCIHTNKCSKTRRGSSCNVRPGLSNSLKSSSRTAESHRVGKLFKFIRTPARQAIRALRRDAYNEYSCRSSHFYACARKQELNTLQYTRGFCASSSSSSSFDSVCTQQQSFWCLCARRSSRATGQREKKGKYPRESAERLPSAVTAEMIGTLNSTSTMTFFRSYLCSIDRAKVKSHVSLSALCEFVQHLTVREDDGSYGEAEATTLLVDIIVSSNSFLLTFVMATTFSWQKAQNEEFHFTTVVKEETLTIRSCTYISEVRDMVSVPSSV